MKVGPKVLFALALLTPQGVSAASLRVLPGSTATFVVHARKMFTHEEIVGLNTAVSGSVQVPDVKIGTVAARIEIDASAFKTGNGQRDEHVREALKAESAAKIVFELVALPGFDPQSTAQAQTLTAEGRFSVAGHNQNLKVPLILTKDDQGWRVRGSTAASFKSLQVTPPGIPVVVAVQDSLDLKVELRVGN